MSSLRLLTSLSSSSHHSRSLSSLYPTSSTSSLKPHANRRPPRLLHQCYCALIGFQEMATQQPQEYKAAVLTDGQKKPNKDFVPKEEGRGEESDEDEVEKGISKVQVPRQKFIPVSKTELLDAIVLTMFDSQDDAPHFHLLASCLDSILHAEHKSILEEMRNDYSLTQSVENEEGIEDLSNKDSEVIVNGEGSPLAKDGVSNSGSMEEHVEMSGDSKAMPFIFGLDLRNLLKSSTKKVRRSIAGESGVAVATRFQRSFMQLLKDAQFEELSARDLMLTSALNTDYLLTLPIYVDWKRASESNAIIFRRGYATETQKGMLIVEKLDYIQSKLLQGLFFIISKPLEKLGTWLSEALKDAPQTRELQDWLKRFPIFQQSFQYNEQSSTDLLGDYQISGTDFPIWMASQSAVSRYEGLLSSIGPRGRLLRRLLAWIGLLPPIPEKPFKIDSDSKAFEPYLRPIFLSRISLSDIWKPATKKYCGNDLWKRLKTSISILFSQSILQEPAFQELILLYTKEVDERGSEDTGIPSMQLKIYERIPIPDLAVIFPDKKLSFRIIDAVRLDAATILGLLAYFINYKFENLLSSPSAIFLDVVAVTALIIYITRVVLGYKQTWDRYQLLVNRTLYEKTLASGFGTVHFLLDASEQQKYKEALLAYAILLKAEKGEVTCRKNVGDKCERFMYDTFKVKVEMPVDKAMDTLLRMGLVNEVLINGRIRLQAISCTKAYEVLKQRWNSLLG